MLMGKGNILFLTCQFTTSLFISLSRSFQYESAMQESRSSQKVPILIMQTGGLKSALNFNRRRVDLEIDIRVFHDKKISSRNCVVLLVLSTKSLVRKPLRWRPTTPLPTDVWSGREETPSERSLKGYVSWSAGRGVPHMVGESHGTPMWTARHDWKHYLPAKFMCGRKNYKNLKV